jgi:protein DGCR14
MVERAARIKRAEKAAMEIKTPVSRLPSSPMFASGRTPGGSTPGKALTPAAQKLLQRVGSTPKTSGMGSSSEPKNIWTPTPRRR